MRQHWRVAALMAAFVVAPLRGAGDPVAVRYTEGLVHGYLTLDTLDGVRIAAGELTQTAHGPRVVSRLIFRFKDGSLHDETTVFSQQGRFRLLTDHLVQHGPSFPTAIDLTIDAEKPHIHVRYTDESGGTHDDVERQPLPPDLSNGIIPVLLKNMGPRSTPTSVSFVAATPKPRVVKLAITRTGTERFSASGGGGTAIEYVLKVDLGGLTGFFASMFGKQPPDSHVWIAGGDAPAFLKAEQPFYAGGPLWRIELTAPTWPKSH